MEVLVSKSVDNELTPQERRRLDEHLEQCSSCKDLLSLFHRNESILSNALSTETFGSDIIRTVMKKISSEMPTPAIPESRTMRLVRSVNRHRLFETAMAAALLLAIVGLLFFGGSRRLDELKGKIGRLEEQALALGDRLEGERAEHSALHGQNQDLIRELQMRRLQQSLAPVVAGNIGFFDDENRIVLITAKFQKMDRFVGFDLWRRREGQPKWMQLNTRMALPEPKYEDRSDLEPGQAYEYKFVGRSADGSLEESAPIRILLPVPGFDLNRAIRIRCLEASLGSAPGRGVASFSIEKTLNGRRYEYTFPVNVGEELSRQIREVDGRAYDLSTEYILDRVEESDQVLTATAAYQTEMLEDLLTPHVTYENILLHVRPNLKVVLRRTGSKPGTSDITLWRYGSVLISSDR